MGSLQRFVDAQQPVIDTVFDELRAGRKTSHWMWFVFPQLRGLGRSPMAQHYALAGRAEAVAYLQHPLLGPRLLQCLRLLLSHHDQRIEDMLGEVDAMKLRSCATLFAAVAPEQPLFRELLARHYEDRADPRTLALLDTAPGR